MKIEKLRAVLPEGQEPPPALLKLAERDEELGGAFLVCDFELTDTGEAALADNLKPDVAAKFAVFGKDGSDSLYAFWLYRGDAVAHAPVIYFSSDWEGTRVLANSFEEFMSLLAVGKPRIGAVDEWDEAAECDDAAAFGEWLKSTLGSAPPADPKAVVAAAGSAHPDLKEWIDEQMGESG